MPFATLSEGKGACIDAKGKTITGSGFMSINGELEAVSICLDNGAMLDVKSEMVNGRAVLKVEYLA